jgi:hypothetical protein
MGMSSTLRTGRFSKSERHHEVPWLRRGAAKKKLRIFKKVTPNKNIEMKQPVKTREQTKKKINLIQFLTFLPLFGK